MGKASVGVTMDRIRIETKTRFGQFGHRIHPLYHPAAISVARVNVRRWNDHSEAISHHAPGERPGVNRPVHCIDGSAREMHAGKLTHPARQNVSGNLIRHAASGLASAGRYTTLSGFRRPRWQVLQQVSQNMHPNMDDRSIPFTQAVISIRVDHIVEWLSQLDEPVNQAFNNLNVRIGLAGTSYDQQPAFETFGEVDWC